MTDKPAVKIEIDAAAKGKWKTLGGSDHDQWNERLSNLVTWALPINQKNTEAVSRAGSATFAGVVDMSPADPIEGMLMSHLVVVNEAALNMYRLAWLNNAEYFKASTRYLQLADKATRTLVMLTEQLGRHRNKGQQQIVVKHVTVNADQAVVTDTVVTGKPAGNAEPSPALLAKASAEAMPRARRDKENLSRWGVSKRNEHQPHAKGTRGSPMRRQVKADRKAMSCACGARLLRLPDAWRTRWRTGRQAKRELPGTAPTRRKQLSFGSSYKSLR